MTRQEWLAWVPTIVLLLVALASFIGRNWIKARIDRSVQFTFDRRLETVRAELRAVEERLRSELRVKEAEIAALRDGALSGRAQRQALLAERRQMAVERVWAASTALAPYRVVASLMSRINVKAASDQAPNNAGLRKFMETISTLPADFKHDKSAIQERPFISPMAWAYFSALETTLLIIYTQAKVLSIGVAKSYELIDLTSVREMLKKALPHQASLIDQWDVGFFFLFVEELENSLFTELTRMLEGSELDKETVERSKDILRLSKAAASEVEKQPQEASIPLDLQAQKHAVHTEKVV